MTSKVVHYSSPTLAELLVITWALEEVTVFDWEVTWSLDVQTIVKELNSNIVPTTWYLRYLLIHCHSLLVARGWSFEWNARSSNRLIDILTKKTLIKKISFTFINMYSVAQFPNLLDAIMFDVSGCGHL